MRSENFVAFFVVSGFFTGLIFSVIKFDAIEDILFYTFTITLFFYLFIHVVLTFYLSILDQKISFFDKKEYENMSNIQITQIKEREDKITAMLKSIHGNEKVRRGV